MKRVVVCLVLLVGFSFYFIPAAQADEIGDLKAQIRQMQKQMKAMEQKIDSLEAAQRQSSAKQVATEEKISKKKSIPDFLGGINIGAGATFVVQGTDNANNISKDEDVIDASYSFDLELEKEFADFGKAFVHLETGDGAGVEDELQVFSNVNRDADDSDNSVALTELWYEHYLKSIPLTMTFGKIDPTGYLDTNEYANDECGQFLGRIFRNSSTIEFPDNSAGVHFAFAPWELLDLDLVLMDADSDWEDALDSVFFGTQFNFKPNLFNRPSNWRFVGWFDDRGHTQWNDSTNDKEEGYGFGISLDQELTDNLGVFARYGWQDPDVYLNGENFSLEYAWSTGIQLSGSLWGRDEDRLGLAIGQVIPSGDYQNARSNLQANNEGHFEAYYSYMVNEHLTLSPDLQVIWNPYGDDAAIGDETIIVGGMRGQVDF